MKKLLFKVLLIVSAGVLTACTTIRELPMEQRKGEPQGAEYDLCRDLLKAFMRNDGKTFLSYLPDEMREKFSEKQFKASRKSVIDSMGEPISFQYVTALELTAFTPHIWKIRFERTDPRNGKKFTSEILFRIITGKMNGKPVVIGFQFL
ncbi:MAG: hypothetical protein IJS14_03000 [Lentisphaeria bacterium]|nr:hypothetical protein [Lentisphaeria bacterium]